jgi:manganese transport protein
VYKRQKYELFDTLFSMIVGWAINSAMILMAAATFFRRGIAVDDLAQAESMLRPLLGNAAATVFAVALLLAGVASSITAGMAGGSIVAGLYREPYNSSDYHTRVGVAATLVMGAALIWTVGNPLKGLILSQICLSIQLPWTIFLLIWLTSSRRVMGKYANRPLTKVLLFSTATIVVVLNVMLLVDVLSR